MRESEETIFVWGGITDEQVINRIKKSVQEFRSIGLEVDEIILRYKEERDRGASNTQGEQEPFEKENTKK